MKKKKSAVWLAWCATGAWCVICLYLAGQELTATTKLSDTLTHFVLRLFELPGQTYYMTVFDTLRQTGHIVVFMILSVLVYTAFITTTDSRRKSLLCSSAVCAALSVGTEVGKLFISGRHCSFTDMLLNLLGCTAGIVLTYIVQKY